VNHRFLYIFFKMHQNIFMVDYIFRFISVYFFMTFIMKLIGKRQIGEMQMSELITAFFLSELATFAATDERFPLLYALIPIAIMAMLEILISYLAVKFTLIKKIFDFSPSILINDGKILEKELLKNRITLDELFSLLRLSGYYELKKVRFAILEPNGQLSVIPYQKDEPASRGELRISGKESGFTVTIINDGRINEKGLLAIGKNTKWLNKQLEKEKISNQKDVFLFASDFSGESIIIKKDNSNR